MRPNPCSFRSLGLGLLAITLPLSPVLAQCITSPSGVVSWWTGDIDGSDVLAVNSGVLTTGATAANAGLVDGAFAFDGSGGHLEVADDPSLDILEDESVSVEAWIKVDPGAITTSSAAIAWKWESDGVTARGYQLGVRSNGEVYFAVRSDIYSIVSVGDVDDGQWHHVVGTRRVIENLAGETIATAFVYIDGLAHASLPVETGTLENAAPLLIGDAPGGGFAFNGLLDEITVYDRALDDIEIEAIFNAGADGRCKAGGLTGQVLAECPDPGTPLYGVNVDIYSTGDGTLVATATTDESGAFTIPELTAGQYSATVVLPLGYETESEDQMVTVASGGSASVSYDLSCADDAGHARAAGFWKRQVGLALCGWGGWWATYDEAELASFLDLVDAHFFASDLNPVEVYTTPASGDSRDKLLEAADILSLRGPRTMTDRARKHLLAVLLNVASGRLSLSQDASWDGASVTQAITYCDQLIDDVDGDHRRARDIAFLVSVGLRVPSGWIPLDTDEIAYREGVFGMPTAGLLPASPNPFVPRTTLGVAMDTEGAVDVRVYDAQGREIDVLASGVYRAGTHQLTWDATDARGTRVAPGVYFARLVTPEGAMSQRLVVAR